MRGSLLDETAGGADGESGGDGAERRPGTSESDAGRGVSPENTSSETDFDADGGWSGAEAADRRAANVDRTGFAFIAAGGCG